MGISVVLLRRRRSALTSAFTPASIFANGEQSAWYDPSDITTLFQDAAGITPVTADSQPVRRMEDKSGNGHHAIAPSDVARPLYRTDGNIHWLEGDGVNNLLQSSIVVQGEVSMLTSSKMDATGGLSFSVQAQETTRLYIQSFATGSQIRFGCGSLYLSGVDMSVVPRVVNLSQSSSLSFRGRIDGVQTNSGPFNSDAGSGRNLWLFAGNDDVGNADFFAAGKFYGGLCLLNDIGSSSSDQTGLEEYLAEKAGVTL